MTEQKVKPDGLALEAASWALHRAESLLEEEAAQAPEEDNPQGSEM